MKRPPPEPFDLPVVRCPACGHGINPHVQDPDVTCGVGWNARRCDCRWSPNDIAAQRLADLRERVEGLPGAYIAAAVWENPSASHDHDNWDGKPVVLRADVLALLGGGDE